MPRFGVFLAALGGALIVAASAAAHAEMSPAVALTKHGQVFTLAVPTEKSATTTKVELTLPDGFSIDSFVPTPDWKRTVTKTTVTWSATVNNESPIATLQKNQKRFSRRLSPANLARAG